MEKIDAIKINSNPDNNAIGKASDKQKNEDLTSIFLNPEYLEKKYSYNQEHQGEKIAKASDYIGNKEIVSAKFQKQSEFENERVETSLTVKDYEDQFPIVMKNGIWTVEKPTTNEYKKHDEEMDKIRDEYIKNHPEPEISHNSWLPGFPKHAKWEKEMKKYMDAQETVYKESHPEYSKQAEAYENQRKRASVMM